MDWNVFWMVVQLWVAPVWTGSFIMNGYDSGYNDGDIVYEGPIMSPNHYMYDHIGYLPAVFPKATPTPTTTTTAGGAGGGGGAGGAGGAVAGAAPRAVPRQVVLVAEAAREKTTPATSERTTIDPSTRSPPTEPSTSTPSPKTEQPRTSPKTDTKKPTRYSQRHPVHLIGFHVKGGTIIGTNMSQSGCKAMCEEDEHCLAVDYDGVNKLCWSHDKKTHCGVLHVQIGTSHFKKEPCVKHKERIKKVFKEIFVGSYIKGGTPFCCPCSLHSCLYMCVEQGQCMGVDYDRKQQACHAHKKNTSCGTVIRAPHTTHYSKITCDTTLQTSSSEYWNSLDGVDDLTPEGQVVFIRGPAGPPGPPGPSPSFSISESKSAEENNVTYQSLKRIFLEGLAAETGFKLVPKRYPESTTSETIHSVVQKKKPTWREYRKFNIPRGQFLLDGISKKQCVELCREDTSCHAVDYNKYNQGCWYHNATRSCRYMVATKNVVHIRKFPCQPP